MTVKIAIEYSEIALLVLSPVALFLMARRRSIRTFPVIGLYLGLLFFTEAINLPLMFFRKATGLNVGTAFSLIFYSQIISSVCEIGLMIAAIYGVFRLAIHPFPGLHRIGKIIFRWVAGVSLAIGLVSAMGPHLFATGNAAAVLFTIVFERVEESIGLLTLCLLLFVCFAIKPLGLSYRSRIFGVSLGLGVISTIKLVEAAWLTTAQAHSIYSPIFLADALGYCAVVLVWGVYFAMPEPERKMILLPTTSPFFFWNRLSEALGDSPGNVAIGFKPAMLAAAEVKIIEAMGKVNREREIVARKMDDEAAAEISSIAAS